MSVTLPLAIFGIENSGASLVVNLLVFFLVVVWLALIYFTYSDAKRRLEDPLLVGCAAAAALFPYVGTVVYLIVRPPEFLEDAQERDLEIKAAKARLGALDYEECPNCGTQVQHSFLRCPQCTKKLRQPCHKCNKPLNPGWKLCPYCETPVRGPARRKTTGKPRSAPRGGPTAQERSAARRKSAAAAATPAAAAATPEPNAPQAPPDPARPSTTPTPSSPGTEAP